MGIKAGSKRAALLASESANSLPESGVISDILCTEGLS